MKAANTDYDLLVIGGGLSGSATALLLRRWNPATRILVVEKSEVFDKKVGEATTELSAFFLSHVLRLHDLLAREHLHKMGLRFWFSDGQGRPLSECSEVSSELIPSLPSFQLDRARLDQSLLEMCAEEGAEVARPARVAQIDVGWPSSRVTLESDEGERTVTARWVVDASGKHCTLGRKLDLIERFNEHPTAAAWGRWDGVSSLDSGSVLGQDVRTGDALHFIPASRRLCTNHFMGHGWWCWVIPLSSGETSIGIVWDRRHFELGRGDKKHQGYEEFCRNCDGLKDLLGDAKLQVDDFRSYNHLAYRSRQYMDRGWALVGDAASFLDPFYSPGLDHCAISVFATANLIDQDLKQQLGEEELLERVATHNDRFRRYYPSYYAALYENKYELFGDAELCAAAFYLDTAMYYLGVVYPPQQNLMELGDPPFGKTILPVRLALSIMKFTNRRLVHIARQRRTRGTYGRRNVGWSCMTDNFGKARRTISRAHRKGLGLWAKAELREIWELMTVTRREDLK